MTGQAKRDDTDWEFEAIPTPPWVRPLSLEEQLALLKEAEDEFARGEGIPNELVKVEIARMIAKANRAQQRRE